VVGGILEQCWTAIGLLCHALKNHDHRIRSCSIRIGPSPEVCIDDWLPPAAGTHTVRFFLSSPELAQPGAAMAGEAWFVVDEHHRVILHDPGMLPEGARRLLVMYAPYCFAPLWARALGRTVAICHLAQTLDGRVATVHGDSKWIGCPENLIHAHRMRALCDGVLIGARTLRTDRPRLTVRHVPGPNPARIVIGGCPAELQGLLHEEPRPVYSIGDQEVEPAPGVQRIRLDRQGALIPSHRILAALYERGIRSILVEGGAVTTTSFLDAGAIDILQLHISPMILGSGLSSFSSKGMRPISGAIRFGAHEYIPMGEGVMFVGRTSPSDARSALA
jgi:diaminohydroxyphosphoribosylaminopyrimidine deaminase/5-amino-6-(5-phosphoribosylamino)uracil reductase